MSYLNIPAPTDILAVSQGQIQTNFALLLTDIARDHIPMTDPVVNDRGKHKFVEYFRNVVGFSPSPAGAAVTDSYTWTMPDAPGIGGITQLFWRRKGGGATVQLTGPDPLNATPGFTFLPGRLLMMWGKVTVTAPDTGFPVNFAALGLPDFSAVPYSIQVSMLGILAQHFNIAFIEAGTAANTGFSVATTAAATVPTPRTIFWLAIGPA